MQGLISMVSVAVTVVVEPLIGRAHGPQRYADARGDSNGTREHSRHAPIVRFDRPSTEPGRRAYAAAISPFNLLMAFDSTWRTRSAEIPYSSASSCRVALSSVIQ